MKAILVATLLPLLAQGSVDVGGSLAAALNTLLFANKGTIRANTAYSYKDLQVFYLETENVTSVGGWGGPNPFPYLFSGVAPDAANCTATSPPHVGFDRSGGDFGTAFALSTDDVLLCQAACCDMEDCVAWAYASAAPGPFGGCAVGDHCCYPKNTVTPETANPIVTNGVVTRPPSNDSRTAPALGVRSAVPLGGLGAGSFELRGDGTFHEWTIINAYPQSTPKLPVQDDAVLAVRFAPATGPAVSRLVRTAPPAWAAASSALPVIAYSGAYPASLLNLSGSAQDPSPLAPFLPSLYAFSPFKPGSAAEAAHPAAAFSLAVANPDAANALSASFMLQLPAAAWSECTRVGGVVLRNFSCAGYVACLHACAAAAGCVAWSHDGAAGTCVLTSTMADTVYTAGGHCGVHGSGWTVDAAGTSISLDLAPPSQADDPSAGDVTIRAVPGDSSTGVQCTATFAASDDPASFFAAFAANGSIGGGGGAVSSTVAAHGAAVVTCSIPPGAQGTLSLVFSWFFPNRVYGGTPYGNFYANLWSSSNDVATELTATGRLASVVTDIATHQAIFINANSSLPAWLGDTLLNQYSHFRQMLWTQEGFLRMDEAMDCPDLDSVHNDYQRHLPYLWYVPAFEVQKWKQYAVLNPAGYVNENPGFAPGQSGGGRIMGDTTTIWLLETLEFYRHTGDATLLRSYWPTIVTAATWQIQNASAIGLPTHLVCTYDILGMEVYNTTAFNGVLHLAAMRAVEELAAVVGDNATAAAARVSFAAGQAAMTALLWNSTHGYFRAYTGGDAIMADSLYGQVVAWAHGLGWLLEPAAIASHLAAELKYNGNAFGLTVVTGRHTPPPAGVPTHVRMRGLAGLSTDFQDDAVWEGGAPDWSVLALALGNSSVASALEPTRLQAENVRSRLNDLWNYAGLYTTDSAATGSDPNVLGQPLCTSHYGFALTDYYLLYALAGQQTNLAAGSLSFAPQFDCPFSLPAMMQGVEATLSCERTYLGQPLYTYKVAFGQVTLPPLGLSVNGLAWPGALSLGPGDSVTFGPEPAEDEGVAAA